MGKKGLMAKILELFMEQKDNCWIFFGWNSHDNDDDNNLCSRCSRCSAAYNI